MDNFRYIAISSADEAVQALQQAPQAHFLAGGTDLVPLMKDDIVRPATLVDISRWRAGAYIRKDADGLKIGALTTLSAVAANPDVRGEYTALAQACSVAATPQLRNMGTIGGNLLQQTRCWYYRGPYHCWLKGGDACYAREGENEYHSVFFTDPAVSRCVSAHPSDPAAALLALDAVVRVLGANGEVRMPLEELYALPTDQRRSFVTLPEGALITDVVLPVYAGQSRSAYVKAMARASWSFALAGVAIRVRLDGDRIAEARIALSGVAPIPVRSAPAEALLVGRALNTVDAGQVAEALVAGAEPLSENAYKIPLLRGLLRQALDLVGMNTGGTSTPT